MDTMEVIMIPDVTQLHIDKVPKTSRVPRVPIQDNDRHRHVLAYQLTVLPRIKPSHRIFDNCLDAVYLLVVTVASHYTRLSYASNGDSTTALACAALVSPPVCERLHNHQEDKGRRVHNAHKEELRLAVIDKYSDARNHGQLRHT